MVVAEKQLAAVTAAYDTLLMATRQDRAVFKLIEKSHTAALADKQRTIDSLESILRDQALALLNGPDDMARRARTVAAELEREAADDDAATAQVATEAEAFIAAHDRYLEPTPAEPWADLDVVWLGGGRPEDPDETETDG